MPHLGDAGREALRAEVRRHVGLAGTRRSLPPVLHVGRLGGERAELALPDDVEEALAPDLVTRLLDGVAPEGATAWITRSGPLAAGERDLGWLAATDRAFGRHGHDLPCFYLVTREGWLDLRSEQSRRWARLRGAAPPAA